ncbi:MAG: glutamate-1-semialdehyde 2,1-aminomutase [Candidatus Eremiobacteraeota bacterium]|nr:glutamate-1-semialdehyde 2,1-aminomutase [Candidatus Eremiobacteraeota bacterium]MCW5866800.1 glutamate-1-semialdehyde 2,1-aminomutase [Candidatus Eremiobacteraeota bacterium]
MQTTNSDLFSALSARIPGGVNSPFRAFQAVGGTPPVLVRGRGARVWDVEGNEYLDFCCAWGPLMLGHSHPELVAAGHQALEDGSVFGASTPWELEFVEAITAAYPSMEKVRLVNSGAEAVASALRVARGATGKPRIVKFEGCYHGHVECLDSVGLEAEELGGPLALGASPGSAAETLIAHFNDLDSARRILEKHSREVAALIVEPIPGSMAVTRPEPEFLSGLRGLCDEFQVLLIFDEVLSGCRVARGGAQELFGVRPDLTCLGKALAGGMPVGAYGGRSELMDQVAPLGKVYQAGTFCGNPLTVRCGTANLRLLAQPGVYAKLAAETDFLVDSLAGLDQDLQMVAYPGMFGLYFAPRPVSSHKDLEQVDLERYRTFYHRLLRRGIYLPPSSLDAAGLSLAHTRQDLERFVRAVGEGLS